MAINGANTKKPPSFACKESYEDENDFDEENIDSDEDNGLNPQDYAAEVGVRLPPKWRELYQDDEELIRKIAVVEQYKLRIAKCKRERTNENEEGVNSPTKKLKP